MSMHKFISEIKYIFLIILYVKELVLVKIKLQTGSFHFKYSGNNLVMYKVGKKTIFKWVICSANNPNPSPDKFRLLSGE